MNIKEEQEEEFGDVNLSGSLSSIHLSTEINADKLLDELTLPTYSSPYSNIPNNNNTYDQFFEEVSLDLPRQPTNEEPTRLKKFIMPKRSSPSTDQEINSPSSEIAGPFYSISDVLDDTTTTNATTATTNSTIGRESGDYESIDVNQPANPRAARRNVNEAEVIATSGGTSIGPTRRKSILNPFKRSKSISQKPSPLETVISKTRPRMLPPKDPHEEKKHLQEYEAMMKKARKLEAKKQKEIYRRKEEKDKKTFHAIHIWENDIIPQWKTRVKEKRTALLWDQGVPPRCRKKVWKLKIGNNLNISKSTFTECTRRVPHHSTQRKVIDLNSHDLYTKKRRPRRTSSLDVLREHKMDDTSSNRSSKDSLEEDITKSAVELSAINNDIANDIDDEDDDDDDDTTTTTATTTQDESEYESEDDEKRLKDPTMINFLNKAINEDILRTLPSLCVFQPDGPLFMSLRKVLHAYVGYRPNLTYSRGASFLAGVLLLNMNAQETFTALLNMISNSPVLSALYNSDEKKIQGFFKVFNVIFAENLPKLYLHFKNLTLTPENYLPDWFMTIFASIIPLELSSRLWDIYLLHGDIILFRTGLVVLKYLEPLLWGGGFSETVKVLNMGFVGEHRGEEVKAALAVSGHITEGDEDPFFDEILGRKGVTLDQTRFNELLGAHMPRSV